MTDTIENLRRLHAEATQTPHGWWQGEPYGASFREVGNPASGETIVLEDGDNSMCDVWAGDPANEEDNLPLICECGEQADAALIVAMHAALPKLLACVEALADAQKALAAYEATHDQDRGTWQLGGLHEAEALGCAAQAKIDAALASLKEPAQ